MKMTILGAGPIAFGAAALAAERGHEPLIWAPAREGRPDPAAAAPMAYSGHFTGERRVAVEHDLARAIGAADAVFLALRTNGHRDALDAVAAQVAPGVPVIIGSQISFSAAYLARALERRGQQNLIVALSTTITTGRRHGPLTVLVSNIRKDVGLATLPAGLRDEGLALCTALFGERFTPREDVLAIALSSVSPQVHLALSMLNFTRIEKAEVWDQNGCSTEAVAALITALDEERCAIARVHGVEVQSMAGHNSGSFGAVAPSLAELFRQMAAKGQGSKGPTSTETRYVTEDVPFGIAGMVVLGRILGVPTPVHGAGLTVMNALYGRDFTGDNPFIPALGLADLGREALAALVRGTP